MLTSKRARSGRKLIDRMSLLLDCLKRGQQSRRVRQQNAQAALTSELLEKRTLLTGLIGIDLGGGTTPTNWASFSGTMDGTLTNLTDESGAATGVDVFVDVDSMPGNYDNFTPSAVPTHTQSLAGVDRMYFDVGGINFDFSNLTPSQNYEVYVFGGDSLADTQRVQIIGATTTVFSYSHGANEMFVNRELSDAGRTLDSYAEIMETTASGTMTVRMDSAGGADFNLMAVAIREVQSDTIVTVSTTADSGAGSFRQAILDANAATTPATIMFELPNTDGGFVDVDNSSGLPGADAAADVFRIQPTSANLPSINNVNEQPITIDGLSQTAFGGDTNPNGPEIEIDGSLLGVNGHGLVIDGDNVTVQGFAVNNFSVLGILVSGDGDVVSGNYIGTDATGRSAAPNAVHGVQLSGATNATVGGTTAAERNVISGNTGSGLFISNMSQDVSVAGNYIGVDATGSAPLGNDDGIRIDNSSMVNVDGTTLQNVISGNTGIGVAIVNSSDGVTVSENSIYNNSLLGIDLEGDGTTSNDPDDSDSGSNGLQNTPLLSGFNLAGDVFGSLQSMPNMTYTIELFDNSTGTPADAEGETFLTSFEVTTDGTGFASFAVTPGTSPTGLITGTATDPNGNTSEFSSAVGLAAMIVDNGDSGYASIGSWTSNTNPSARDMDVQHSLFGLGQDVARWEFTGLTPGNYRVSATWAAHPNRATNTPFRAFESVGGSVLNSTVVDQEQSPNDFSDDGTDWEDLFVVEIAGSSLVIEMTDAANQYVIADAVRIEPTLDSVSPVAWIIDNGDAGFVANGAWNTSFLGIGHENDLENHAAGMGADTATWTFTGLTPGNYLVSATWLENANRATDSPFTIFDGTGGPILEFVKVNQELAPDDFNDRGSDWENLAVVQITGTELVVQLSDDANQYVIADAIRIEPTSLSPLPMGVIIDDGDAEFATTIGWNGSPLGLGRDGDLVNSTAGDGSSIATWTFATLLPGTYQVAATWVEHPNRATDSPFTIRDGIAGPILSMVDINQQLAPDDFTTFGSDWEILTTVTITGSELVVELSDDANGYVIADAIRIQPVPPLD